MVKMLELDACIADEYGLPRGDEDEIVGHTGEFAPTAFNPTQIIAARNYPVGRGENVVILWLVTGTVWLARDVGLERLVEWIDEHAN